MNPFVIAFRRIIYSIPLKVLLLLLAVFGILFACFSKADYLNGLQYINSINYTESSYFRKTLSQIGYTSYNGYACFNITSFNGNKRLIVSFNSTSNFRYITDLSFTRDYFACIKLGESLNYTIDIFDENYSAVQFSADFYFLPFGYSIITGNPGYTSLQCQTEYNLIPIESVDQNYCTTNNLCPSSGTPSDCPNVGVSNLYINDLFHPGAFNVIMNIPEEIDWDYAYTNSGQNINIDVVGYNQDFEKIEGWIQTNNYKPTSEDFTNIFTSFSSFGGLLIACLFVILVFYFVKKMFK